MDNKQYIASGILELYVAGSLSEKENIEVYARAQKSPEILKEIEAIENAILRLSKTVSPGLPLGFSIVKKRIDIEEDTKTIRLEKKDVDWSWYVGWAASILLTLGLFWVYTQNKELKSSIQVAKKENTQLEKELLDTKASLKKSEAFLTAIGSKNSTTVVLDGQKAFPKAYAKAYWNKKEEALFIDAQGLPKPPKGMVYQVWSLKLNPLTPTSIGLLDGFMDNEAKVFSLNNVTNAEAFGITLEPDGGSESPNLEQLYTLGTVSP